MDRQRAEAPTSDPLRVFAGVAGHARYSGTLPAKDVRCTGVLASFLP
jgi:hypothetical protein